MSVKQLVTERVCKTNLMFIQKLTQTSMHYIGFGLLCMCATAIIAMVMRQGAMIVS